MARPKKLNADYFPHDANERNKTAIKAIRRKFSHVGYAVWNYLQETLTGSENFRIPWDEVNIELLAADYEMDTDELVPIVEYAIKIGLLERDADGAIFSAEHRESLKPLILKRERDRNSLANQIPAGTGATVSDNDNQRKPATIKCEHDEIQREPSDNGVSGNGNPVSVVYGNIIDADNPPTTDDNPRNGELPQISFFESKSNSNRDRESNTHTVSFLRKGVVGGKQDATGLLTWIEANFPAVHAMAEPFNEDQATAILAKFRDEDITRIVEAIDNKGGTRNKSAYATFNSYVAHDHILKERAAGPRPYSYNEICDLIYSHGYKQSDFEVKEIDGVRCYYRKIDIIRTQA